MSKPIDKYWDMATTASGRLKQYLFFGTPSVKFHMMSFTVLTVHTPSLIS